jgi:hypothetical protein
VTCVTFAQRIFARIMRRRREGQWCKGVRGPHPAA